MEIQDILKRTIDLHVHIGPEIIPRRFDFAQLIAQESGKMAGVAIKNHFFPTIAMNKVVEQKDSGFLVINSVTLNCYAGGFNPEAVYASAKLSTLPIIVWFPTINAANFLIGQKWEISPEWLAPGVAEKIKLRLAGEVNGLTVLDNQCQITAEVDKVLSAIKDCNAILATGHLSWLESKILVYRAIKRFGIKKVIITHPIYQRINMPLAVQQELAEMGAIIEQCYSMYSIDKISIAKIAQQIRAVGADNCLLSSDVGQTFSPSPSEAMLEFIQLLSEQGISVAELNQMTVVNPRRLIGLI